MSVRRLKVEYDKNRCIGNGNCAATAPDYFTLSSEGRAILQNSIKNETDPCILETECDENTAQRIILAGKNCPVNAIKIVDVISNKEIVGFEVKEDEAKLVFAEYDDLKEFVLDNKGYFLIRIDVEKGNIEVAFCNDKNKIILKVIGKKPIAIYHTVLNKEKLPIRRDHAAYLGRELQKAFIALKNRIKYVQDDELDFSQKR